MTHHILKNADTVSSDTVEHLIYTNCFYLLSFCRLFNKDLGVQIVMVARNVLICLSQQKHYVKTLFQLLRWQMTLHNV